MFNVETLQTIKFQDDLDILIGCGEKECKNTYLTGLSNDTTILAVFGYGVDSKRNTRRAFCLYDLQSADGDLLSCVDLGIVRNCVDIGNIKGDKSVSISFSNRYLYFDTKIKNGSVFSNYLSVFDIEDARQPKEVVHEFLVRVQTTSTQIRPTQIILPVDVSSGRGTEMIILSTSVSYPEFSLLEISSESKKENGTSVRVLSVLSLPGYLNFPNFGYYQTVGYAPRAFVVGNMFYFSLCNVTVLPSQKESPFSGASVEYSIRAYEITRDGFSQFFDLKFLPNSIQTLSFGVGRERIAVYITYISDNPYYAMIQFRSISDPKVILDHIDVKVCPIHDPQQFLFDNFFLNLVKFQYRSPDVPCYFEDNLNFFNLTSPIDLVYTNCSTMLSYGIGLRSFIGKGFHLYGYYSLDNPSSEIAENGDKNIFGQYYLSYFQVKYFGRMFMCFGVPVGVEACSGHGECISEDDCLCEEGYFDKDCSVLRDQMIVISDTHFGIDPLFSPTGMNAVALLNLLKGLSQPETPYHTLIFNGDILDNWLVSIYQETSSIGEILSSYVLAGVQFSLLLKSILENSVKIVFLPGNHDMGITQEDFDKIGLEDVVVLGSGDYLVGNVWIEHGHEYDLFNREDPVKGLKPVGYHLSRLSATAGVYSVGEFSKLVRKMMENLPNRALNGEVGIATMFICARVGIPKCKILYPVVYSTAFLELKVNKGEWIPKGFTDIIQHGCFYDTGNTTDIPIYRAMRKQMTLLDRYYIYYPISYWEWLVLRKVDVVSKMAQVGQYGDYKSYEYFFQEFANDGIGLFVLGHTHKYTLNMTGISNRQGALMYANSGTWVDEKEPTFVTIQMEIGKPANYVKIFKITSEGTKIVGESPIYIPGDSDSIGKRYGEEKWVPEGWTCSPMFYNDSVCDCDCGVWDPDCLGPKSQPRNCFNLSRQLS